jgi:hypothetical protein
MIADIGAIVEVTPWDDVWVQRGPEEKAEFLEDCTPLTFRVESYLYDGQLFYGICGPILDGPERYRNLRCNIIIRADATDWRIETESECAFKVCPNQVVRSHSFDWFCHPDATKGGGFPLYGEWHSVKRGCRRFQTRKIG